MTNEKCDKMTEKGEFDIESGRTYVEDESKINRTNGKGKTGRS